MDKQIREISKKRTWKRILRRSVALLCAVVMLFTMNTLKRNADTLERIAMCGYAEHVHSASCFSGDVLVCGMEEHVHTDACYQERPSSKGMDDLDIEVDEPIVDETVEDLDLSLELDGLDLVTEDVVAEPVSNEVEEKVYNLGTGATVSQIIEAVGLNVGLDEIKEVGAVENDEAHSGLIAVERVDSDYRIWAKKDFTEAELALILADDILVVELRDGIAQGEGVTPEVQPAIEAMRDELNEADEQPSIEDATDDHTEDDERVEVPVIEDEAPVVGQTEETVLVEDVSPDVDEQTDTVEQPSIDDEPDERAEDTAIAEQLAHEGEALAEDAGTEVSVPVEEESDETASPEDAVPVGDDTVIAEDEGAGETVSIEEEEQAEEQPADEAAGEQGEEQPADEAAGEQGEEQPAEEAVEAQDQEQPAEEAVEAQDQEQLAEEVADEQGEEQLAEEAAEEQGEEQPAEEAAEEQGEEQPAEEAAEELGEEQPVEEETTEEQGEEQPADEAADEQGEDQPAEEAAEEQGEEQPAEEATGEQGEEQPVEEETTEEQGEEQPADEAAGEQGEEQPVEEETTEEQGEEQPAEEATGELGEEQPAEEATGEQGEEQPAEEATGEQGEEQPAEKAAGEQEEEQPADEAAGEESEEQPAEESEPTVYKATIDLIDVETYPLSLNAMIAAATPEQEQTEEADDDAEDEGETAEEEVDEEQQDVTIEYDVELLDLVERDGDYLVKPIRSFESTQIIVTNGSHYELTLVNCVLATHEKPEEEGEQQEEAQPDPVYTATIDLTDATYPLSLNEMITAVKSEQGGYEETQEDQAEEQHTEDQPEEQAEEEPEEQSEVEQPEEQSEEQPTLTIDYDEALLEIVESDGDWLVTPVQSFESTQITVANGSRYELTLVNCVLTDGEQEEQEVIYPAKTFEGHTDYVKVSVTAPEGAFPEGTTMTVADVEDKQTITDIEETVSEDFVEVKRVHAVDISFWNGETEIEPLVPISVVISVAEIEEQQDAVVVHVDNEGATEVVESQSEAPAGETEVMVEMPASEAGPAPSDAEEQGAGQPAEDSESPEEEQTEDVVFSADSFSVYAVVVTETIETKYIDAEGETWNISVGFTKEANIPVGAKLAVSEVESEDYLPQAEAALEGGKRVTLARFFDISIVDAEGNEVQPEVPVTVNISLDNTEIESIEAVDHVIDNSDPVAVAMHFEKKDDSISVDVKRTTETEEAVVFDADGFSVWGVVYTVDFYFGDYEYHLPGEGYITLSDLFGKLEIDADAAQAKDVVFSNPELVAVVKVEEDTTLSAILAELGLDEVPVAEVDVELGEEQEAPEASEEETVLHGPDWLLVSLAPFDTEEKLTVTMEDGTVYEIIVKDATDYQAVFNVNDTAGGQLWVRNGTYYTTISCVYGWDKDDNATNSLYEVKPCRTSDNNRPANAGWHFVKWVEYGINDYSNNNSYIEPIDPGHQQTYTACFAPDNQYFILYTWDPTNGDVDAGNARHFDYIYPAANYPTVQQYFSYSGDTEGGMRATPHSGYFLKGWYDAEGNLVSKDFMCDVSQVDHDTTVHPVFEPAVKYTVMVNDYNRNDSKDNRVGTLSQTGSNHEFADHSTFAILDSMVAPGISGYCTNYKTTKAEPKAGFRFVGWVRDDGATPATGGNNGDELMGSGGHSGKNLFDRDTTFVAFFVPENDYLIRLNWPKEGGSPGEKNGKAIRTVNKPADNSAFLWYYHAKQDQPIITAKPASTEWLFDGWYNNGSELISRDTEFNVWGWMQQAAAEGEETHLRDLNLTPVFRKVDTCFHVWFDGTNGIGGGHVANNTFYTRIESTGKIQGTTSVHQAVAKSNDNGGYGDYAYITLPTKEQVVAPQSVGNNGFELKGWYCVTPENCNGIPNPYKNYYLPGDKVIINDNTVFYADWFPASYDIGQNVNTSTSTDTSRFITTRVFDYNNLFNMDSISLNRGESSIPIVDPTSWTDYNKEYWYMNGTSDDFVFLSTVSGTGRSLNPIGRGGNNSNNELGTGGNQYNGTVSPGLMSISGLKNRLFAASDGLGKRYVGTANYLYTYDQATGYYYYDSDKNAASYNQSAGRFYVYNYKNCTDKSTAAKTYDPDNSDFLPFNYGNSTFTEAYGSPNYWFGMSSEINFFLPNAVSAANAENPVNFSDHDMEMVYKFAGDDDVWVYVDGQLVLDMGGVHGKVYGEINFSRGTWTIAQNGTVKTVDDTPLHIMSYGSGGNISHGTINLSEGDHTLTLYYLERGASQSNCAIYFNIAPRYGLRFIKQDNEGESLGDIRFGIYTDPECTIAADLNNNSGAKTNEFFDGDHNGMTHARNLVAGRTYYIKEIKAPNGYPDMSSHIIKLELDAHGKAKITPPADATWMVNTTGLTEVANETGTYYLGKVTGEPDMYLLTVVNKKETSITASKTWAMLDGSTFVAVTGKNTEANTNATAKIKLQRRVLAEAGTPGAVQMGNHKVKLVTRYFVDGNGNPSNRDNTGLKQVRVATYSVKDNNDLSFTLNAPNGSGIYSVVASSGNLTASDVSGSSGTLYINGGTGTKPTTGTYTLSGVQSDAVIYITFIGTGTPSAPTPNITDNIDSRLVVEDTVFNELQTEDNGGIVTLNSGNNWTTTWSNLDSSDASRKTYYYYVTEVGGSTSNIPEGQFATSFISTTSSDGLSSGTIMVNNTLQSVRVMLRKRDAVKAGGKNVYLSDGKYELHIGSADGKLYTPPDNALDRESMGENNGAELTGDTNGRFYTGYLPVGDYYLVEKEAPEGYEPTTARHIVVNESGVSWDRDGNGNLVEAPLDSNGYYSLYLNNTVQKGSILIQKLWKSESNYGLTKVYDNAYSTGEFGLDNSKLYSVSDNGATAVLLSLGAVVDGAMNADVVNEVLNNPGSYGLTDKVVEVSGKKYIRLEKNGTWPALEITNLPLKHQMVQDNTGTSKEVWFYIEEYGYYDASNQLVLVANKTANWTVSYGYANGAANGTGKTQTINGTTYTLVKPKTSNPDTLTVTNGFKGGLEFTKKNAVTNAPVQGAVFQIIPNGAGEGNYITGADAMLTSDSNGKVTISGLPVGTYWMWEKSSPSGYRKTDNMYCLVIGYPNSHMYLADGSSRTETYAIDNTPVGSISIAKTVQVGDVDSTELAGQSITFGLFGSQPTAESVASRTYSMTLGQTATTTVEAFTSLHMGTYWVYEVDADNHPILDGGTIIVNGKAYTVSEATPNVTLESAGDSKTVSITNNYSTIDIPVMKIWDGNYKPACVISVDFTMYTDATYNTVAKDINGVDAVVMLSSNNGWRSAFTDLPEKDSTGATIQYYLKETRVTCKVIDAATGVETTTEVTGNSITDMFGAVLGTYTGTNGDAQSVNYRTITNTRQYTDVDVEKMWDNGTWPEKVTRVQVTLKANNEAANVTVESNQNAATVTLTKATENAPNANKAAWFNLPKYDYDGNGDQITYTVEETAVTYDGTTYTSTSDIPLSDLFQITTNQPTDGHATITNQLKQTEIKVLKQSSESPNQPLSGAEFTLERKNNGVYSVYGTAQTSGANGLMTFSNLPDGDYRLEETGIPAGYARTSSGRYIYFKIAEGVVTWDDTPDDAIKRTNDGVGYNAAENNQFTVDNTPGVSLPSTGGSGTAPICAAGLGMIVVAVLGLMLRRRKARDVIE